jgi:hypothetical protein
LMACPCNRAQSLVGVVERPPHVREIWSLSKAMGSAGCTRHASMRGSPTSASASSFDPATRVQNRSISEATHQAWSCGQNRLGDCGKKKPYGSAQPSSEAAASEPANSR